MKDWDFIAARRKLSLEGFLKGVSTIEDALEKFSGMDIIPPERSILDRFFNGSETPQVTQPEVTEEQKHEKSTPSAKYDDIVIIETDEAVTDN